jgi:hypothetical protein
MKLNYYLKENILNFYLPIAFVLITQIGIVVCLYYAVKFGSLCY